MSIIYHTTVMFGCGSRRRGFTRCLSVAHCVSLSLTPIARVSASMSIFIKPIDASVCSRHMTAPGSHNKSQRYAKNAQISRSKYVLASLASETVGNIAPERCLPIHTPNNLCDCNLAETVNAYRVSIASPR